MSRRSQLRALYRALDEANSYEQWHEAALAHDVFTGVDAWRADDDSSHVDAPQVRRDIRQMRSLRESNQPRKLAALLQESLYRHGSDLADPDLYGVALAGPKHFVADYLDEVTAAIAWLAAAEAVPKAERLHGFVRAARVYGRTALMLSGGATLGFHHLGVVKGLFELGLLPEILSGASTGAMIAAGVCARNDEELAEMYADTDQIRLDGLLPVGPVEGLRRGALLEPAQLESVLRHNIGPATFAEAHAHSGRTLNISVSPTRLRQKPRLLTYLTAPDVTVISAVMASSALPGLFPPVELRQREGEGDELPHLSGERWVDGSIYEDLPKLRLARLHNVNHFIVSQTNPHVLPFVRHHGQQGLRPAIAGLTSAAVRSYGAYATDVTRRATRRAPTPVRQVADQAYALVSQDYRGDIDLHPQFHWRLYKKVVSNPSRDDLTAFIREGQRSVWPKIAQIRDQTRIRRALDAAVDQLRAQEPLRR
ncbi:MAG: DUF3336 domain-containing protein [Deltaproteobacteria bacterium]|nr:MAG: DUF3336 domain-containing protein [Deltaproteobacteria bacterium]